MARQGKGSGLYLLCFLYLVFVPEGGAAAPPCTGGFVRQGQGRRSAAALGREPKTCSEGVDSRGFNILLVLITSSPHVNCTSPHQNHD